MLNKAQLIGYLGQKPKTTVLNENNGVLVASLSVATTERGYKTREGKEIPSRTEWHDCVCYGRIAEIAKTYLKKGSKVFIEGKMKSRQYTDKNGVKHKKTVIHIDLLEMLDGKNSYQQQESTKDGFPF